MMATLDARDVFYVVAGLAFLGFTVLPMLASLRLLSVPTVYVVVGAGLVALGLPILDPLQGNLSLAVVEHTAELVVIVSIAGAGLAVDRPMGRLAWHHTWALLIVTMPLTIVALVGLGMWWAGLPLASAVLLGACLSPTDPVLARTVQVDGPNQREEDDVRVSLTTEAGLNDGLAFPVVYLALALAALAQGEGGEGWLMSWLSFDVAYRLTAAVVVGAAVGHALSRFVFGPLGDARRNGENAGLVLLASTFLAYGLAEAIDGYGFLLVFVCARASRAFARGASNENYLQKPHHFSDQFEKVLLSLLLLWLGGVALQMMWHDLELAEVAIALALVFIVRPVAGWMALWPTAGSRLDHLAIASLGIRGLGTVFYIAYAQSHGTFEQIEAVWRIGILSILISIAAYGVASRLIMDRLAHDRSGQDRAGGRALGW